MTVEKFAYDDHPLKQFPFDRFIRCEQDPVYIIMLFLEKENGTTCIVHSYDSTCSVITFLGSEVHRISSAGFVDILLIQGGHGTGKTGKTGNLVLTFSRQGKHREFCFDTGKNSETQGKYFSVTQGKI